MASIQCLNCKKGIHYHGEPCGIEYVTIPFDDWRKITTCEFDPRNKIIDQESGYPKLFQSDTIEEDFPDSIIKFWKCPDCGMLLFFDRNGIVTDAYMPEQELDQEPIVDQKKYVYFSDYEWDDITEKSIPDIQLPNILKVIDLVVQSQEIIIMQDNHIGTTKKYKKI